MTFDPNKPYEHAPSKGGFDPNKPYESSEKQKTAKDPGGSLREIAEWAEKPRPNILPLAPDGKGGTQLITPSIIAGPIGTIARGMYDVGTAAQGKEVSTEEMQRSASGMAGLLAGSGSPVGKAAGEAIKKAPGAAVSVAKKAPDAVESIISTISPDAPEIAAAKAGLKNASAGTPKSGVLSSIKELPGHVATELSGAEKIVPTERAIKTHESGYKLPPNMVTEGKVPFGASLLSGEGGKHKVWQEFSVPNQANTNRLAAADLGLREGQKLSPEFFETVHAPLEAAKEEIRSLLPPMPLDSEFKKDISAIGGHSEALQKAYPGLTGTTPMIAEIKNSALSLGEMAPEHAIELTRSLRNEARQNIHSIDPDKQRLGLAQADISKSIEAMMERSLTKAPELLTNGIASTENQISNLIKQNSIDRELVSNERSVSRRSDPEAYAQAVERIKAHDANLDRLQNQRQSYMQKLQSAKAHPELGNVVKNFQDQRKRSAKAFDYEAAYNPSTGNVSAQKLHGLRKSGRPLSGGGKDISDAYAAHPQVMQMPERFGGVEDRSYLDMMGALGGGAGNAGRIASAIARPYVRRLLATDKFQNKMFGPKGNIASKVTEGMQ